MAKSNVALLVGFIRDRKKWWLTPIVLTLVIFGVFMIATQSSAIAPFIYTVF